jgi:hypothetical protein
MALDYHEAPHPRLPRLPFVFLYALLPSLNEKPAANLLLMVRLIRRLVVTYSPSRHISQYGGQFCNPEL